MNSKEILKKSSEVLKGKWILSIIAVYIYTSIISVPSVVASVLASVQVSVKYGENVPEYATYLSPFNLLSLLVYVVQALVIVGFVNMIFKMIKEDKVDMGCMFTGVKHWCKALGIILLTALYTLLWSLLLIVPGIIKSLSYSMALYIYAKNPEKGVKQCIDESVELMNGNKMKLFKVYLRYFIWTILACVAIYIPFIVTVFINSILGIVLSLLFMMIVLTVVITVVMVHEQVAYGVFYLDLIGELNDELNDDVQEDINTEEVIVENISFDNTLKENVNE